MRIRADIVNKFNTLLFEVLSYYELDDKYVTTGNYGLYCINLTKLGYQLGSYNAVSYLRYINRDYLIPFYLFYTELKKFEFDFHYSKDQLLEINRIIKKIRKEKEV